MIAVHSLQLALDKPGQHPREEKLVILGTQVHIIIYPIQFFAVSDDVAVHIDFHGTS